MTTDKEALRVATAWPQDRVDNLDLAGAGHDLLEEIVATAPSRSQVLHNASPKRSPRWEITVAAAAAAVIAAVSAPFVVKTFTGPEPVTFAPAVTQVAEANPRLLVSLPGWEVSSVQTFTAEVGEMTFTDGTHELDVHWRDAGEYRDHLAGRVHGNPSTTLAVLGQDATMVRYRGSTDFTTILPPTETNFLEIRGDLGGRDAYLRVLDALTPVSTSRWLAAMPDNVVVPSNVDEVVAEMLTGLPLPAGFQADALSEDMPGDRYQVGANVAGAVMCAWLDRWDDANKAGDEDAAAQAVTAMQSSRDWPVLDEMNAEGDYPEVLWEIADGAAGINLDFFNGELTRQIWVQGLGCDTDPRSANMD